MKRGEILEIVVNNIEQLVETFPEDSRFKVSEDTPLFGQASTIDSLSLVSVIVDLETLFADEYGKEISLTDDRAMTREVSPFSNVRTLTDYIHEII